MLNKKEKKQLKSLSVNLKLKYQIGKNEITENVLSLLDNALTAHELIKIVLEKNVTAPVLQIALDLSSKLHAEIVNVIGKVIVLYRENKEKHKIILKK